MYFFTSFLTYNLLKNKLKNANIISKNGLYNIIKGGLYIKTKILLSSLLVSAVILNGCSSKKEETKTNSSTTEQTKQETPKEKIYGLNDEWVVEGQWKLKITSVTPTAERNQFSEDKPAQVVVINYTYENLGYTSDAQDLFLTPSNVIDEGKKVSKTYPAGVKTYPKPTPVGAIMDGAQAAYGLQTESKTIKIIFEHYDGNKKKQKATFEIPVK